MIIVVLLSILFSASLIDSSSLPPSNKGSLMIKKRPVSILGMWPDLTDGKHLPLEALEFSLRPKTNKSPSDQSESTATQNSSFMSVTSTTRMTPSPILSNIGKYSPVARMALHNNGSQKDLQAFLEADDDEFKFVGFDDEELRLESDLKIEDFENEEGKVVDEDYKDEVEMIKSRGPHYYESSTIYDSE